MKDTKTEYTEPLPVNNPIVTAGLLPWMNTWQLDYWLYFQKIKLFLPDGTTLPYGRVSIARLPIEIELKFAHFCTGVPNLMKSRESLVGHYMVP